MTPLEYNQLVNIAPAERNISESSFDQEMKCFPYLFINGKNGFAEPRQNKLGIGRYINASHLRFTSDPQYIFYNKYVTEMKQIISSVCIAMRKSSGKSSFEHTTASMLTYLIQRNS